MWSVRFEVDPLAMGVTDIGSRPHVGANAGWGDTEQVSDTGLLNPLIATAMTVKTAADPGGTVAVTGSEVRPKS